jgi:hypothetical protein
MMARLTVAAVLTATLLHVTPTFAATPQEKLETCNFGADEKKLTGAARKSYIARCTADRDSPRGKPQAAPKNKQTQ